MKSTSYRAAQHFVMLEGWCLSKNAGRETMFLKKPQSSLPLGLVVQSVDSAINPYPYLYFID